MNWADNLTIDCIHGDVLQANAEVLACNTNIKLGLQYSLGRQLVQRFGYPLVEKVTIAKQTLRKNEIALGETIWVDTWEIMPFNAIIFFGWWDADNEFSDRLIYQCFINVLRNAFNHECRSIALPLFGSGSGSMNFNRFQKVILNVLTELNSLPCSDTFSVEELMFYSTNSLLIQEIDKTLARFPCY